MDSSQPKDEAPPPQAPARGLQSAPSSSTASAADKVSFSVLVTRYCIVAETFKTITDNTAAADMSDQSSMQDSSQQSCHLLKLSTELRLEICRLAFQHDVDVLRSTPYSYNSTNSPLRGALALLHTCRTLRLDSIDGIEPLARASKSAFVDEWLNLRPSMMLSACFDRAAELHFRDTFRRMGTGVEHIEKVCDLLALARRGGEDKEARGEKD